MSTKKVTFIICDDWHALHLMQWRVPVYYDQDVPQAYSHDIDTCFDAMKEHYAKRLKGIADMQLVDTIMARGSDIIRVEVLERREG